MRKTLIAAIVIVLIAVISVGYLGYTYLLGQNHAVNNPPAQTSNAVENLRDQAMTYLAANHTQTIPIMPTSHWSGGRVGTGLVGAELYQYTNGEWQVSITYPVVPNPIYTVTCNFTSANLTWVGTYQNSFLETGCSVPTNTTIYEAPQIRDLTMMYLQAYHNESTSFMHEMMTWSGGKMDMGMMVGSNKYSYMSNGWNVTMQNPVVPNPPYTITAVYSQANMNTAMITWIGTLDNGIIKQTSYEYNP